jgi:hypothetical protein
MAKIPPPKQLLKSIPRGRNKTNAPAMAAIGSVPASRLLGAQQEGRFDSIRTDSAGFNGSTPVGPQTTRQTPMQRMPTSSAAVAPQPPRPVPIQKIPASSAQSRAPVPANAFSQSGNKPSGGRPGQYQGQQQGFDKNPDREKGGCCSCFGSGSSSSSSSKAAGSGYNNPSMSKDTRNKSEKERRRREKKERKKAEKRMKKQKKKGKNSGYGGSGGMYAEKSGFYDDRKKRSGCCSWSCC